MGLKDLFFGGRRPSASAASTRGGNQNLKAQAYDSAIALEAPVRGSYPVAGNGPNVLDEIQRSRAKKDGYRQSTISRAPSIRTSFADAPPDIARWREDAYGRPMTAPHNGKPERGYRIGIGEGRTRSGFTTRSPPVFHNHARLNSLQSDSRKYAPSLPISPPSPPSPPLRDIRTYQPTKVTDDSIPFTGFTPPFVPHHQRNGSNMSHKSYVDILDAHSNIRPSQDVSKHRAKASGMRNYGEDVADRNIADFGGGSKLDLNSPQFSYLKTIYSTNTLNAFVDVPGAGQGQSSTSIGSLRTNSTLGHVLGLSQATSSSPGSSSYGDDITSPSMQSIRTHAISQPIQSNNDTFTGSTTPQIPRSGPMVHNPSRSDAPSVRSYYPANGGRDDPSASSTISNGNDQRVRALFPLSASSPVYIEEHHGAPAPSIPTRGRSRTTRQNQPLDREPSPLETRVPVPVSIFSSTPKASLSAEVKNHILPVSTVPITKSRPEARKGVSVSFSSAPPENILPAKYPPPSLKDRKRTMSGESQNTYTPSHKPKIGTGNYSPHPNNYQGSLHGSVDSIPRSAVAPKRKEMLVEGAKEPPSLARVVDLSNTVDTDVTTKTLPAVIHEHVTPTRHEIREERVTREIHYHNVYHRILPVIETAILPTKHFIHSPDGQTLIEISESEIPKYTGRPLESVNHGWKVVKNTEPSLPNGNASSHSPKASIQRKPLPTSTNSQQLIEQFHSYGPYIHKGTPESLPVATGKQSRICTDPDAHPTQTATTQKPCNILEPTLISKKTYQTPEGYPRTEYFWRHPPVFEDNLGRTQPIYMTGILDHFDIASPISSVGNEEDKNGIDFGAATSEDISFQDSGYGGSSVHTNPSAMSPQVSTAQPSDARLGLSTVAAPVQPVGTASKLPEQSYMAPISGSQILTNDPDEKIQLGKVLDDVDNSQVPEASKTGEATSFLRRLKEKRRSGGFSIGSDNGASGVFRSWSKNKGRDNRKSIDVDEMERRVSDMNIK